MNRHKSIFILTVLVIGLVGCSDDAVTPAPNPNLIVNGSFESDGDSSLAGWELDYGPVKFSTDVPPGGGKYSVSMNDNSQGLITMIPTEPGTRVYRMSAWGRKSPGAPAGGSAWMALVRGDSILHEVRVSFPETTWTTKSIGLSISVQPGDSIGIALRGIEISLGGAFVFFDRIALEFE